ncbi:DNA invertase Pin-like site-specific DNA recombinase [Arthrobacter sp. UYCu712]
MPQFAVLIYADESLHAVDAAEDFDRQVRDLLAAGVRRDDLYTDHGVSGARASRPAFNRALEALHEGDTLVITTLDRLGRSTVNMLGLADELRARASTFGC